MTRITKNTILQYISDNRTIENSINRHRIFNVNDKPLQNGIIAYFCDREIRINDNFALQFGKQKSVEYNLQFKIIFERKNFEIFQKQNFFEEQMKFVRENLTKLGYDFEETENISEYLNNNNKIALLIVDFNPIRDRKFFEKYDFKIVEIDGHNIVPARYVSEKQEYNASTLRSKIYGKIDEFLTEFVKITDEKSKSECVLDDFIKNKLQFYAEKKNNPTNDVLSGMSKYLNWGFISSQRIALNVIKADVETINKEVFIEELIIRKELADNFCLFAESYKDFSSVPNWAKNTLNNHRFDLRAYVYDTKDFEFAKTHDRLWNATQNQLLREGKIHGYLRMYWAKKILEWTKNPEDAIKTAIYLNDKYAFDAPSSNGYVGILWAIAGLHDRAFQDWFVTGKIRRMTDKSISIKFPIQNYIVKYS